MQRSQQLYLQKVRWRGPQTAQTALPQGWWVGQRAARALRMLGKALGMLLGMTQPHYAEQTSLKLPRYLKLLWLLRCAEQTGLKSPRHLKLLCLLRLIGFQELQTHLMMQKRACFSTHTETDTKA